MAKSELDLTKLGNNIKQILDTPFWPPDLQTNVAYSRLHDDADGTGEGHLIVAFDQVGDASVQIDTPSDLRFRTEAGGGTSPRVRNALLILALAIELDNKEHPQE